LVLAYTLHITSLHPQSALRLLKHRPKPNLPQCISRAFPVIALSLKHLLCLIGLRCQHVIGVFQFFPSISVNSFHYCIDLPFIFLVIAASELTLLEQELNVQSSPTPVYSNELAILHTITGLRRQSRKFHRSLNTQQELLPEESRLHTRNRHNH
jgi:hypothetical protein